MLTTIIIIASVLVAGGILVYLLIRGARNVERTKIERDSAKKTLDRVFEAQSAREEVSRDPDGDLANRVRDKYRRK